MAHYEVRAEGQQGEPYDTVAQTDRAGQDTAIAVAREAARATGQLHWVRYVSAGFATIVCGAAPGSGVIMWGRLASPPVPIAALGQ